LAQWGGSMTRRGGVITSDGGEVAPRRGQGGDEVCWADANLSRPKNEEHPHSRFSWYKWMVKI
jgi:hypothetical protein